MSKPVKEMILADYQERFQGIDCALVIDIRGINANDNNTLRAALAGKQVRITVVKNELAKQAFRETGLEGLNGMLDGPSAVVYGEGEDGSESAVSIARELIDWAKKLKAIEFKGAVMEGAVFEADEIDRLSKFPTRDEAQGQIAAGSADVQAAFAGGGIFP
jgi:large subunit ribosomal protein L10